MANPNFSVSLNRLSIHNLPRTLNSAGLKKLFIEKVGRHAGIKQVQWGGSFSRPFFHVAAPFFM